MRRSRRARGKEGQYGIGNLTLLPPRPAPTSRAASVCEESFAGGPSGFGSEPYFDISEITRRDIFFSWGYNLTLYLVIQIKLTLSKIPTKIEVRGITQVSLSNNVGRKLGWEINRLWAVAGSEHNCQYNGVSRRGTDGPLGGTSRRSIPHYSLTSLPMQITHNKQCDSAPVREGKICSLAGTKDTSSKCSPNSSL